MKFRFIKFTEIEFTKFAMTKKRNVPFWFHVRPFAIFAINFPQATLFSNGRDSKGNGFVFLFV